MPTLGKNETSIEKTIILQQKAIRIISFANFRDNSIPLFKELNLLKFKVIIERSKILFTHNAITKKTPIVVKDYITLNEAEHQHDTINNLNSVYSVSVGSLQLPTYRKNSGKSPIKYICVPITRTLHLKNSQLKTSRSTTKIPFGSTKLM